MPKSLTTSDSHVLEDNTALKDAEFLVGRIFIKAPYEWLTAIESVEFLQDRKEFLEIQLTDLTSKGAILPCSINDYSKTNLSKGSRHSSYQHFHYWVRDSATNRVRHRIKHIPRGISESYHQKVDRYEWHCRYSRELRITNLKIEALLLTEQRGVIRKSIIPCLVLPYIKIKIFPASKDLALRKETRGRKRKERKTEERREYFYYHFHWWEFNQLANRVIHHKKHIGTTIAEVYQQQEQQWFKVRGQLASLERRLFEINMELTRQLHELESPFSPTDGI